MKLNHFSQLIALAGRSGQNRLLFDFNFYSISFKCLLFTKSPSLLFSIVGKSVGYTIHLQKNGYFDGSMPKEFYRAIVEQIKIHTQANKLTPLWKAFDEKLETLTVKDFKELSDNEVIRYIGTTTTHDDKYDIVGSKPYFYTFQRNSINHFTPENLRKTERYFGRDAAKFCEKMDISSKWKENPTEDSLLFLDREKTFDKLKKTK